MPTFAEIRRDNFYRVLLDERHFARPITVREEGREDRTVVCVFRRTAASAVEGHLETDVDTATVRVGRDEAHAKGGIAAPRRGLQFVVDDAAPWAFLGTVLQETSYSLVLEVTRPRLARLGRR